MTTLLITSGDGPVECRLAVAQVLRRLGAEAEALGLSLSQTLTGPADAPQSAILRLDGPGAETLAAAWLGSILWRCPSPLRPHHKRANWFVGVFELPDPPSCGPRIAESEVRFASFRAGGPGGQHQNTTDSAVRATWQGFTAVSREERSQHQNRRVALLRLQGLVDSATENAADQARQSANRLHHALERGNPTRSFQGRGFDAT